MWKNGISNWIILIYYWKKKLMYVQNLNEFLISKIEIKSSKK
jgi:hypothetical protein